MKYFTKKIYITIAITMAVFSAIAGIQIYNNLSGTIGQLFGYGVLSLGFSYLMGMIYEYKTGFEQKIYTGKQYAFGILIGIIVCTILSGVGSLLVK